MKIDFIVCEDNPKTRRTLCDWLNPYIDDENIQLLLATSQPDEVLAVFEDNDATKICLLDINLNKSINGVALAEKIKNLNINTRIIFITAYAEWAVESLNRNIEPFAYLTKPLDRQTFDWHIKRLLKKIQEFHRSHLQDKESHLIKLEAYGRVHYKKVKTITYIETYHKEGYLVVHTLQGEKIIHKSRLNDMLDYLNTIYPDTFIQCYKSNLVNYHFIEAIDKKQGEIMLKNGTRLFMSRSKEVQEKIERKIMGDSYDQY
ncbi:two component transcriptional regulator, LytTR family [Natronincola peptidivorans]|uniref:Stage 0 sporulation protein A homolog n=1 Tax=Natronincola peptidivorans TaxID=426128 RepID=A0A1I0ASL4_9FIRM|nr:LytTR family DNA-binding domain-containing protein [Natronincola peptidivorans]SES96524.1 two component transcriptional regulator, LytTR family [Natronincola peptidivorans]